MSEPRPRLDTSGPARGAPGVVLILPGGRVDSLARAHRGPAYLRMLPFSRAIHRTFPDLAVWRLRYRYQGWNEPERHPVLDARWALSEAARLHPGAPVLLIGHSMGGRVALLMAADPGVGGVCALAPWLEESSPLVPCRGPLMIAHGARDRVTDPVASLSYAARVGSAYELIPGEGHALLHRPRFWQDLVLKFVAVCRATLGA